jgi:hypothetical protein
MDLPRMIKFDPFPSPERPDADPPIPEDLARLDAALRAWGSQQRISDSHLAERVLAASRPQLRSMAREATMPPLRLRLAAPARFALAASLLGALLLASFWGRSASESGPQERSRPGWPPLALLDDSPLSEPILLAMLDSPGLVAATSWRNFEQEGADGDLLSVLYTQRSGFDDYAAEIESILGGSADGRPWGL